MADCGVNGTAIDRTVQTLLGSTNASGGVVDVKVAAAAAKSLMGHASQQQPRKFHQYAPTTLPLAPPSELTLPETLPQHPQHLLASTVGTQPLPAAAIKSSLPRDVYYDHPSQSISSSIPLPKQPPSMLAPHQSHPMMQHDPYTQQMMMMQSMMMQQQQQLAHMVHQQNQAQHQQNQAQHQPQRHEQSIAAKLEPTASVAATDTRTEASFGDDLLDESQLKDEIRQHLESLHHLQRNDLNNLNDAVSDANQLPSQSIEDLAAAWAEAEAEYAQEMWAQDASHLASVLDAEGGLADGELQPYQFVNQVAQQPNELPDMNWMEQGMQYFRSGDIKEAIHAFEHELQLGNANNAKAWRMLGRCHAENDQDREAILCFEHAVDRDPYSAEALLDLGVSYVNELNHEKALEALLSWVTHNPKYAGHVELLNAADDLYGSNTNTLHGNSTTRVTSSAAFEEVQKLLLRALEVEPTPSADVLQALGVVYNVSGDYDAAVDMFQKALQANQNSSTQESDKYQLWNKLGATLANSHRSEQALPAYHQALKLKPKYARGWLNLAISHSNLHHYAEAARCYLQTLSLNPSAVHCWSYLRIALTCEERFDLLGLVAEQNLQAFREHYDFVIYPSESG